MVYVCSDIHGRYDLYLELLDEINLQKDDKLYILGDVIDRNGNGGIDILQDIMRKDNIQLLIGNHELFMINVVHDIFAGLQNTGGYKESLQLWTEYNGGRITLDTFLSLSDGEQEEIYSFLYNCLFIKVIIVGSKKFHLSHSYTIENRIKDEYRFEDLSESQMNSIVWKSPYRHDSFYIPFGKYKESDSTYIIGHVPTQHITGQSRIFHKKNIMDIDCGCAHSKINKHINLGCIRLDDMQEFYVQ